MNLLEELFKNSYRSESLLFAFSEEPSTVGQSSQSSLIPITSMNQETHSKKEISQPVSSMVTLLENGKTGLSGSNLAENNEYFVKYREKLTKINSMVSLLSAKNRKMKYQFMVHLERWVKLHNKVQQQRSKNKEKSGEKMEVCLTNGKQQKNLSLMFENLSQIFKILENRVKEREQSGLIKIKKQVKLGLKIQVLQSVCENIKIQHQRYLIQKGFHLININNVKNKQSSKIIIKPSDSIRLPLKLKALKTKDPLDSCIPFSGFENGQSNSSKLPFQHPQFNPTQNIDYYDTLTLFMQEQTKREDRSISQFDLSFNNNGYDPSAEDAKKETLSQQTYIKQLSDIELTGEPSSAFAKRKISDFTISNSENRAMDNFSQVAEKTINQPCFKLIKSEVNLHSDKTDHQQSLPIKEPKERQFLSPRTNDYHHYLNFELQASQPVKRYSFQREAIPRSGSEARVSHKVRFSAEKQGIDRQYEEELDKYKVFKKYLQQRRESTMKGIEKNQKILKKLMDKFQSSKKKAQKLKITLQAKGNRQRSVASIKKQSKKKSNTSTPFRSPSKDPNEKTKNKKDISSCTTKKSNKKQVERTFHSSLERVQPKQGTVEVYSNNMNAYYNYMKDNNSYKGIHVKNSPSQKKDESKKQIKSNASSIAQKNLLTISKFPHPKEQRVNLRVDIPSRKVGKQPEKEKHKNKEVQHSRANSKNHLK